MFDHISAALNALEECGFKTDTFKTIGDVIQAVIELGSHEGIVYSVHDDFYGLLSLSNEFTNLSLDDRSLWEDDEAYESQEYYEEMRRLLDEIEICTRIWFNHFNQEEEEA
ncbi:hypothetical protein [Bergeriella denitrificans]|uniref:Uncharacterized protein n=1 Tax=Bergeriella denitrificans TaxID=494 RepID=A0A378UKE6_BERDE|nr:hypothetical protein [Bergeriella denitrificans]STZ76952.1 Uncharacterised protein [Bergeriella denitrificans]